MKNKYQVYSLWALMATAILIVLTSCTRSDPDVVAYFSASITDTDAAGNEKVTLIEYNNMGSGEGSDGKYGTKDDDVFRYMVLRDAGQVVDPENEIEIILFNSPGLDGEWFTSDDSILFSESVEKNSDSKSYFFKNYMVGNVMHSRNVSNADILNMKLDNIIQKAKWWYASSESLVDWDVVNKDVFYSNYEYFDGDIGVGYGTRYDNKNDIFRVFSVGEKEYSVYYLGTQFDLDLMFSNNFIRSYYSKMIDFNTGNEQVARYDSSGNDGVWFTEDDELREYRLKLNEGNSATSTEIIFSGAGDDGVWFTDDDLASRKIISTFDDGLLLSYQDIYLGADGVVDTSYDGKSIAYRESHEVDATEHKITRKYVTDFDSANENVYGVIIEVYRFVGDGEELVKAMATPITTNGQYFTDSGHYNETFSVFNASDSKKTTDVRERKTFFDSIAVDLENIDIDKYVEELTNSVTQSERGYNSEKEIVEVTQVEEGIVKIHKQNYIGEYLRRSSTRMMINRK